MNRPELRQRHDLRYTCDFAVGIVANHEASIFFAGWYMDRRGVPFAVQCRLLMPFAVARRGGS